MSNPFASLSSTGLEVAQDTLGGFAPIESGVYDAIIKIAFAGQSKGGAHNVTFHLDINGREHRETIYVTNKQGENFYLNKRDQTKKMPLPGFTMANNLALLATGFDLGNLAVEERVIKLWDKDAAGEINTKVNAFVDLTGKAIKVGIIQQIVDKNVDDGTGKYVPSGETRNESVLDAVFHAESDRTVNEVKANGPAEFLGKWEAKNKGQIKNRSSKVEGQTGRPGATAGGDKPKSMFG